MTANDIWRDLHRGNSYFKNHACYGGGTLDSSDGMEIVREFLLDAPDGRCGSMLDFGCGYGRLMPYLLEVSDKVVGFDVAPEPLVEASRMLRRRGLFEGWELILGFDGKSLRPVADGRVDRIVSVHVFQHLPRAMSRLIVADMARVLTPRGRAALLFLKGPHTRGDFDMSKRNTDQSLQYSEDQLVRLARGTGLAVKDIAHQPIRNRESDDLSYMWLVLEKEDAAGEEGGQG